MKNRDVAPLFIVAVLWWTKLAKTFKPVMSAPPLRISLFVVDRFMLISPPTIE
jgi:hypothetical protein